MPALLVRRFGALAVAALLVVGLLPAAASPVRAVSPNVVISQVYGGGGNSGATYTHDFVELFNRGSASVSLAGWSIQYASATGTGSFGSSSTQLTELPSVSLAPGQYLLVQEAQGSGGTTALPTPDVTDASPIAMSGTAGKVALVNATASLGCNGGSTPCSSEQLAQIVDLVGYGSANFFEGSGAAPTLSNTTTAFRASGGCVDTDDNAADFSAAAPMPRNTASPLGACGPLMPVINEFSASTTGTDVEYVEIYGSPSTDYSAYTVLEIEGDFSGTATGTVDEVIALGTTGANGLYLVDLPANALENGTITLLLVKDFTGALGNDLDTNDDGTFDTTPWASISDSVAVIDSVATDLTYGTPALGPNYDGLSSFAPGGASRIPDGLDTGTASDWVRNDFDLAGIPGYAGTIVLGEAYNTPGAPNEAYAPPPEACGDPFIPIHDIQGNGAASPVVGTEVATEGIVVGDFQNNASPDNGDLNGFHVQAPDADADADPTTSEGVFIYAPGGIDVAVGDAVRVRGSVSEYNGLTEVTASQIWICSTGATLPTAASLSLPMTALDAFEPFEGMRVTFPQDLAIAEYFNFDRFGEIVLSSERRYQPTAVEEPGPDAIALAAENVLDRITLDDGRSAQNPDPAIHPNGSEFTLDNLFRGGDTVANVTGVLDYSFSLYRVQPTAGATYTVENPRPAAPDPVGGTVRVASMNTLNYFLTLDYPSGPLDNACGPGQDVECRGADDANEFDRQRAKLLAAIEGLDADVVGLNELENTTGVEPLADLVAGLNATLGAGTYAYINTGVIGTDAIRVGLIYQPAVVTPVGAYAILDTSVDPRFLDTKNRPVLGQAFEEVATGARFTVAVNHLKSKGSDCNDVGDPDLGDGAGNCNITRTLAAQALVDWLATDPTGSGSTDALVVGDLNSYTLEDPIDTIVAGPDDTLGTADDYTNLVAAFLGDAAYSYVFDGQLGYLDHALASASLAGKVTGVAEWHINADEPDILDYDTSFKLPAQQALYKKNAYRSSDHDPVIVGLDFRVATKTALAIDPSTQQYSDTVTLTATISPSDATGSVEFKKSVNGGSWTTVPDGASVAVSGGEAALAGVVIPDAAGTDVRFKAKFTGTGVYTASKDIQSLTVEHEDAAILYDGNSVAEQVDSPGSGSWTGPLELSIGVKERSPDNAGTGSPLDGDIGKAGLAVQLVPLGPGGPIGLDCGTGTVSGSGYDAVKSFECETAGSVPLGTYEVAVSVTGDYYAGTYSDVFTVYDPSLGFATGGGHFLLDGEKVTFGFTTKYNKKGKNVQGNFIAIRHHDDGTISRLKSNALSGMAILDAGGCGIATLAGKSTYTTWDPAADGGLGAYVTTGNNLFSVRADDCNNPGDGTDKIWIAGPDALKMPSPADANLAELMGGNISVPHTIGKK